MSLDDTSLSKVLVGLPDIRVLDAVDDGVRLTISEVPSNTMYCSRQKHRPRVPASSNNIQVNQHRDLNLNNGPIRGSTVKTDLKLGAA